MTKQEGGCQAQGPFPFCGHNTLNLHIYNIYIITQVLDRLRLRKDRKVTIAWTLRKLWGVGLDVECCPVIVPESKP